MRQKIVVTGANGQLGQELRQLSSSFLQYEFIFLSREELSIHNAPAVNTFFKIKQPQYCINCAAYTAVDKAESEKELAYQVNAEAVEVLAAVCKEYGTQFIHISTDYVFDGKGNGTYNEDSPVDPQSVYGASKLAGERLAMQSNPDSIIIRTAWVYSEFGKNFVKTMLRLMKEKEAISVVNDQVGSATYAADIATALLQIIQHDTWQPGIYHFTNDGIISWFDFAVAIKELTGSHCKINAIPTTQFPTPAKRPAYSVLDKTKIHQAFGIEIKNWKESLSGCLERIRTQP